MQEGVTQSGDTNVRLLCSHNFILRPRFRAAKSARSDYETLLTARVLSTRKQDVSLQTVAFQVEWQLATQSCGVTLGIQPMNGLPSSCLRQKSFVPDKVR